ncbi:exonuclease domain-containing protein [Colwelliaceae bacterium BS250]
MSKPKRLVIIDTETTGLSVKSTHSIIEIAAVEIVNGELSGKEFSTLVNPQGRQITHEAFKVHGIKDYELSDAPAFAEIAEKLALFCQGALVLTYGASFDGQFLEQEFQRIIILIQTVNWLCYITKMICKNSLSIKAFRCRSSMIKPW